MNGSSQRRKRLPVISREEISLIDPSPQFYRKSALPQPQLQAVKKLQCISHAFHGGKKTSTRYYAFSNHEQCRDWARHTMCKMSDWRVRFSSADRASLQVRPKVDFDYIRICGKLIRYAVEIVFSSTFLPKFSRDLNRISYVVLSRRHKRLSCYLSLWD